MMYVTIDEFGRFDVHEKKHRLEDLQEWVGGYVEHLDGPHGLDVWIDEEGKLKQKPVNWKVTEWMTGRIFPGDYIAGRAVVTGMNEKRLAKFREEFGSDERWEVEFLDPVTGKPKPLPK